MTCPTLIISVIHPVSAVKNNHRIFNNRSKYYLKKLIININHTKIFRFPAKAIELLVFYNDVQIFCTFFFCT